MTETEVQEEVRVVGGRLGFVPYWHALRFPCLRLRAVLVLYVPVYVLGLLCTVGLQLAGGTAVVNGAFDVVDLNAAQIVVTAVLLLLGIVALIVAHGAATLVAVAESVRLEPSADVTVRGAVVAAARRLPTLATLWLLGILFVAAMGTGVAAMVFAGVPVPATIVVGCLATWLAYSPFALAWPVALAERLGPLRALRRSVQLAHGRMFRLGFVVLLLGYVVPGGLATVVMRLPRWPGGLPSTWLPALAASVLGWALLVLAVAVLVSVQTGALFYDKVAQSLTVTEDRSAPSPRDVLDRDRLVPVVEGLSEPWSWEARGHGQALVRVLAGLLVPGLLATGLAWWNPVNVPSFARADVEADGVIPVPMVDGSVVGVDLRFGDADWRCTGSRCAHIEGENSDQRFAGPAMVASGNERLVLSGWDLRDDKRLRLVECRVDDCAGGPRGDGVVLDQLDASYVSNLDLRTAVAADGRGGYVVASLVRDHDLTLYRCADLRCERPRKRVLGRTELTIVPSESALLSVAARGDDAVVAVTNTNTGKVTVHGCTDTSCTHPRSTELVRPTRIDSELETQYRTGARVALRPDGRPVVAYRELSTGAVGLASCRDLACDSRTTRRITRPGWGQVTPGLAVDDTGRPLLTTYDLRGHGLQLVSCDDAGCARTTTKRLATWSSGPGAVSLALDDADRPVIAWEDTAPAAGIFDDDENSFLLRCERARCGAE